MTNMLAPFAASVELCTALSEFATTETIEAGQILFRQGEDVKGVYLVTSGTFKVSVAELGGTPGSDRIAESGSVLGLPATMTGNPYSLTAEAVTTAHVGFVERDRVLSLLRRRPELCFEVVEILAHEVRHMRCGTKQALTVVN